MKLKILHASALALTGLCLMLTTSAASAHCAGNHTDGHPHCSGGGTSGGDQDPVYAAHSADPLLPRVESYSVNPGDEITYRGTTINLTQFMGTLETSGVVCDHGTPTGTMQTRRKSNKSPDVAVLSFGFSSLLENGDEAHHKFIMEGEFVVSATDDSPGTWLPEGETTLKLYSWEFSAENKRAKNHDCAGESFADPNGPWYVTVERVADGG